MSGDNNIDRRQLLKSIAVSGALVKWPALAAASPGADGSEADGFNETYAVFSPSQASLMEALVDQIIPQDDFPSAREAGAVHFIDKKLGGPYGSFFIARYEAGLKQMNEVSRQQFHKDFASLNSDQQTALMHAFEDKTHGADLQEFFQTVLYDTFEGYYGSPADGANRNGASWKMIGFRG